MSLIDTGMTIKEASKITDIGYENAKAIKKAFEKVRYAESYSTK